MSSAHKRDGEIGGAGLERRLGTDLSTDLSTDLDSNLSSISRVNVTRSSLAFAAHRRLGFSQSESRLLVDDVFAILSEFLVEQGEAKVSSFGSFSVRSKVARVGRNPRTGEVVPIAPRRVVSFRPSSALRERLRGDIDNA